MWWIFFIAKPNTRQAHQVNNNAILIAKNKDVQNNSQNSSRNRHLKLSSIVKQIKLSCWYRTHKASSAIRGSTQHFFFYFQLLDYEPTIYPTLSMAHQQPDPQTELCIPAICFRKIESRRNAELYIFVRLICWERLDSLIHKHISWKGERLQFSPTDCASCNLYFTKQFTMYAVFI